MKLLSEVKCRVTQLTRGIVEMCKRILVDPVSRQLKHFTLFLVQGGAEILKCLKCKANRILCISALRYEIIDLIFAPSVNVSRESLCNLGKSQ